MKIGETRVDTVKYGTHSIHLHPIESREQCYIIRQISNEIMEEIQCLGVVQICRPNKGNDNQWDMFIYGIHDGYKTRTIIKRLNERIP